MNLKGRETGPENGYAVGYPRGLRDIDEEEPQGSPERGSAWSPGRLADSDDEIRTRTVEMLKDMLGTRRIPCDLALIRSPDEWLG